MNWSRQIPVCRGKKQMGFSCISSCIFARKMQEKREKRVQFELRRGYLENGNFCSHKRQTP